jgi:Rab GTPase-binding effector protein 1
MEVGEEQDNPVENVEDEIKKLETEKKRIQDEFNIQRAKMKELFLQKEDELMRRNQENARLNTEILELRRELDDSKSQLVIAGITLENNFEQEKRKANEEIATLQQLVHETVEESSSSRSLYDSELKNLQTYIQQLQNEIIVLKQQKQHSPHHSAQEPSSLAPSVVLNALTKGIVKKLGAEAFTTQDSGDDNVRKVDTHDHTQEDAEVLRSLIGPLEDQIQALKEKLRATDEQLQKCRECGHREQDKHDHPNVSTNTSFDSPKHATSCDMCSNYEDQLVNEQKKTADLEIKVQMAEKAAERHKEDLLKEIGFRKEMEEKWNEKKEEHKQQVAHLTRSTECAEQDLKEMRQMFNQTCSEMNEMLKRLTKGREKIQEELTTLQKENDNLVGKYTIHSQELQSEAINLPNTVEELHELILKHHQDLIIAKIGKEAAEEKVNTLQSDIMLLRDQITNDQHEKELIENNLAQEIDLLKKQKHQLEKEKKLYLANQEKLENTDKANLAQITELQRQIHELHTIKKQLEDQNSELRTRVSSLQQELDTSETVQKDFVRLSQSLQVRNPRFQSLFPHSSDIFRSNWRKSASRTRK